MKIIYKFPSKSRPEKFFAHLQNIITNAKHDEYTIYPTLDENDYTITAEFWERLANINMELQLTGYRDIIPLFGKSTSKINAVNRDMPTDNWDVLIVTSDDMEIIEEGFDLKIIEEFKLVFPDTDGAIHYTDGFKHDDILSWPVIGRKYYDRFGYAYFPGYQSLYCDEEAILVAKLLGKLISSTEKIIKHNHPANGSGETDLLYKYNDKFYPVDKALFQRRKARNFGILNQGHR